ncbi:MAG: TIGR00269 family protein [Fervidicoccaceae archaeon]
MALETSRLCDLCGRRGAYVYQAYASRVLCAQCLIDDVIERAKLTISRYNMVSPGDNVALALSGGKDSLVLLDALVRIIEPSRLIGISIIEGIRGYTREEDVERTRRLARELGVDVVTATFREFYGASLSEMIDAARARGAAQSPCTFCGVLRRRAINSVARELGATKVATAHNLDDEVQTALINLLRGDVYRLARLSPLAPRLSELFVQRIKPLRRVYEWEIVFYANARGFPFQEIDCPYIVEAPTARARLRRTLYSIEWERPGTLMRLLDALDELAARLLPEVERHGRLPVCSVCGEPTSRGRELCKTCELLSSIAGGATRSGGGASAL